MHIRNILMFAFLVATLVPSVIFGVWSYDASVKREFSEVKDRHLLIAQNLGVAMERYHVDLVATFEAISGSMLTGQTQPNLDRLMRQLDMICVLIVRASDGKILSRSDGPRAGSKTSLSPAMLSTLRAFANPLETQFSTVMQAPDGSNAIFAVRKHGDRLAVAQISTSYFVRLGKAVSFGKKGHAAIVDRQGNVLAHPLSSWVAARKNMSRISSVKRMMNGETGIEQFYSPALKGDMIAGLTTVAGPGWGVMVPQPISEIYEKAYANGISIFVALGIGLSITFLFVFVLIRSLAAPLENLADAMTRNARNRKLKKTDVRPGLLPVRELSEFQESYNHMVQMVTEANRLIETQAYIDSVTGLPNRERFQSLVNGVLAESAETAGSGILALVDLDNFKEINDIHGHDVGDAFLRDCGRKILAVTRRLTAPPTSPPTDGFEFDDRTAPTVGRIGGDKFTVLVPGLAGKAEIKRFLDELGAEMATASPDMVFLSDCSASIGCSRYPADGVHAEDLIKRADMAMSQAKKAGKNEIEMFSPGIGMQTEAEIRHEILIAIETDQLVLEYQPKICSRRRVACGVEALVRWNHPQLGRLSPGIWLPALANSPAMAQLGEWVMNRAMQDHRLWARSGHDLNLAINIGSKHFISPNFIDRLEEASKRHDFPKSKLEIEITEDALFTSEERAEAVFMRLHSLGYSISIDDFGKGYSNIARLARLPVDCLKIDRSIVIGGFENRRIRAIFASTVAMAKELDCKIVAEGVETLEQAEFASQMGANMLQGFYFARSMPHEDLVEWLDQGEISAVHRYQQSLKTALA